MGRSPSIIVFDSNRDALARRVGALHTVAPADTTVTATPSRNAVLVLAEAAEPGTPILIDLCVTDRLSIDRPGERLIERLAANPTTSHTQPYAWSAHVGPDVVEGARRAGAAGFVAATLRREREADDLRRVLHGAAVWPAASDGADSWERWFLEQFRTAWQPWMEAILVRLAAGDERRSVAGDLVAAGAARSANHAAARMREVARLIAGEHSNAPTAVAARASVVLAQLAARRPLAERPVPHASLEQTADALRSAPSLAVAAGLTQPEIDDLLALDELIREKRASEATGAGAPPADRVRGERRWAAGRRALQHGASVDDVDHVIDGILTRLETALLAVDDARHDAEAHPAGRAAAALAAVAIQPGGGEQPDARRTWRGRTAAALALDDELSETDLRRFTADVDGHLRARAT